MTDDSRAERLPMSAGYFDLVLRRFGATPGLQTALLSKTGVSLAQLGEPDAEITLGQQLRQLRNANRVLAPGWSLRLGASYQTSMHGSVGVAATTAATLGDALRLIERHLHLRNPCFRGCLRRRGTELRCEVLQSLTLAVEEWVPLVETVLLGIQGILEAMIGRRMNAGRFEIAAPAPSYATLHRRYFHRPVRCAEAATAVVVPAAWATLRNPFADRTLHAAALASLDIQSRRFERPRYLAARVEHEMVASGASGLPLTAGARRLGVSTRTLVRHLRAAGTTYRDLRDAHRRRQAEVLLHDDTLTAAEIAYRLGYEDAANFGRACRRWFGKAPGTVRRSSLRSRGVLRPLAYSSSARPS